MADHARSDSPDVQAQLDRLAALGPGADVLGLDRITRLLSRLGDPHRALPPVFHVAGTNGKGSTCAFLRAALEAAGRAVHVYSSPHLVRFNERIRLAGRLIDDAMLARLLAEVLDAGGDIGASFFEVTTAAAFLVFARTPAAATIVEVGLGGRLDATNVVDPVVTGIAALGIDHQAFLGDTLAAIAAEKAGIAKPGVPLVTMRYADAIAAVVADTARAASAPLVIEGRDWRIGEAGTMLAYRDGVATIALPHPALPGAHQAANLGLAVTMLRHQRALTIGDDALAAAARNAAWPARLQRLAQGPLVGRLTSAQQAAGVWIDGAHNASAAAALAANWSGESPIIVLGMLANKDAAAVVATLVGIGANASLIAVPVEGHAYHEPDHLVMLARSAGARWATTAGTVSAAFDLIAARDEPQPVLIAGSLYLAGEVLRENDQLPD